MIDFGYIPYVWVLGLWGSRAVRPRISGMDDVQQDSAALAGRVHWGLCSFQKIR